ncbi:polysaccharide biosynthesis protein CapD [Chloroherpeton thalassium ATCC 35110]|uniref:Polysaccharide biosynthesis protein CapD n=1 Tax=Chloroherpeton thalassium (strain ATCC 35110 / GB-78) TaxID=517418 RepID=B3QVK6_CHLT3|nr:nucleoside-diphosphate sugar epimerase/dehydratase [Chloroherpeton thalassium]ACF14606.1 polysaccharide biosynthesis protein CapD [Chloroherpeton thalassium ATCC 35110]
MSKYKIPLFKHAIDSAIIFLSTFIAYTLRLEPIQADYFFPALVVSIITFPIKTGIGFLFGLYRQSWHNVGVKDLSAIIKFAAGYTLISLVIRALLSELIFWPISIAFIEAMILIFGLSLIRLTRRVVYSQRKKALIKSKDKVQKRVLVIGAGEAGTFIVREMQRHPESGLLPIGFLDDDVIKQKQNFLGLPVFGALYDLKQVVDAEDIDQVLIAIPSVTGDVITKVVHDAQEASVQYRTIPGFHELLSGQASMSQIREVDVQDLLRRKPVQLDLALIAHYLKDQIVLVSGAGGSIGSEIVRQVVRFNPRKLILVGRGENSLYLISEELQKNFHGLNFLCKVIDVRDRNSLEHLFSREQPNVVFHAAAHKHVPLMELAPEQAVLNNVGGTKNLVELALKYKVSCFVNISTDKAVNPTSVMGATKRVAEYTVELASRQAQSNQRFVSVRFGNVLGSRGSVIPKFKQQILSGGPVTVTHPEMVRFFMTIPEASQLVLQAGGIGQNGEVYVLDMGEPVKIVDMATELIKLSGLVPNKDIRIEFTGIRPGEKLYEELLTSEEGTNSTHHEKIYVAKKGSMDSEVFENYLESLFFAASSGNGEDVKRVLKKIIPTFSYTETKKDNSLQKV